jgi:hypothetical protein
MSQNIVVHHYKHKFSKLWALEPRVAVVIQPPFTISFTKIFHHNVPWHYVHEYVEIYVDAFFTVPSFYKAYKNH